MLKRTMTKSSGGGRSSHRWRVGDASRIGHAACPTFKTGARRIVGPTHASGTRCVAHATPAGALRPAKAMRACIAVFLAALLAFIQPVLPSALELDQTHTTEAYAMTTGDASGAGSARPASDAANDIGEASNTGATSRTTSAADTQLSINPGKLEKHPDDPTLYYWPNLTIDAADPSRVIQSATVQFTTSISDDDEIFAESAPYYKVLDADKHGAKTINHTWGGVSAAGWQTYLRNNLTVHLASSSKALGIRIALSYSAPSSTIDYCAETGHYYQLVSSRYHIRWTTAFQTASQKRYMGMQGYLVTITSAAECNFITSMTRSNTWIGGTSDPAYVGRYFPNVTSTDQQFFTWVAGPEAGTQIPTNRYRVPGYSNWDTGEPNNENGLEHYIHIYWEGVEPGKWNDLADRDPDEPVYAYVIEYGGMPEDGAIDMSNYGAIIDITLDPSGRTLSTSLASSRIELGDALPITETVNGEVVPEENVTRILYVEDASVSGGWRMLGEDELDANGMPLRIGNYKVVSQGTHNGVALAAGSAKFTVVPKTLDLTDGDPIATKAYDGTAAFDVSDAALSHDLLDGLDIGLDVSSVSASGTGAASAGDKEIVLDGASLKGADAANYKLKVKVRIVPRQLAVTTTTNIERGYANSALKTKDGEGLELGTNLSVRGADAGADVEWLENEMAPCDARILSDGTVSSTILGSLTLVATDGDKVLDPERPEKGTYSVEARFSNVNPVGGASPSNVVKIDEWTYDIGNYVLTIKPATIKITPRSTGGATAPGDGDVDDPSTGTTFAPIDTTTDIRIDPSATGTVAGDPYFEYESGKPVNILGAIQVRPGGGGDWSDWLGGSGSGSNNPNDPSGPGAVNPGDPSVPSNPDGSDGTNDPTNPDGSGSGDGTGNGSGNGTGTNPGGTTSQLPDGVKVVVTDECGNQVDPTNVTDPGTYEVTVSVKDPDTGEFVVVETIKFHIVDTSITDTELIYRDVPKDHWGHGYIFDIGPAVINGAFNPSDVALGYMAGYAGTKDFGPHHGIIRGDAAIVIWRMAGCPDVDQAKASSGADGNAAYLTGFADCDANPTMYWNEAIAWCAANGIVTGYGDTGLYLPQNQITREEFASIIARYAAFKGKDVASATADLSQYPDIDDVSDWAAPNMHYVVSSGIMTGKGTDEGTALGTHGILDPQANVTRAEVAKMTYMEQPYKL